MTPRQLQRLARWGSFAISLSWSLLILAALLPGAKAAEAIPRAAHSYRADLTRQARQVWGLDAPVATFAAQIHTESLWRPDAVSPVGARGLTQFMPATEAWIAGVYPELNTSREPVSGAAASGSAAPAGAMNPTWAIRALVTYDKWLWDRIRAADDCQRMAMVLSSYNGGLGWLQKDQRLARSAPGQGLGSADLSMRWFDGVERFNAGRSAAAFKENRAYPRLILKVREPLYQAAGWGGRSC